MSFGTNFVQQNIRRQLSRRQPSESSGEMTVRFNTSCCSETNSDSAKISFVPKIIEALAFGLAILFSLLLNGVVLWIMTWRRKMSIRKSNLFITNIALCNEVTTVVVMPFVLSSIIDDSWKRNHGLCMFNGYTTSICFYSSVFSLCLISVDRYVAICMATKYSTLITKRRSKWMIAAVWLICAVLSLPPLFGWSHFEYHPGTFHCSPRWLGQCGYFSFVFFLAIGVPNGITVMSYTKIFMEVRKHRKKLSEWKKKETKSESAIVFVSHMEIPKVSEPEESRISDSEVDEDELTSTAPALDNMNFEHSVVVTPHRGTLYCNSSSAPLPNGHVADEPPTKVSATQAVEVVANTGQIKTELQTLANEIRTVSQAEVCLYTSLSEDPAENVSDSTPSFPALTASSVDYFLLRENEAPSRSNESDMGNNSEDTLDLINRKTPYGQRMSIDSNFSTTTSCSSSSIEACRERSMSNSFVLYSIPENDGEGTIKHCRKRGATEIVASKVRADEKDTLYADRSADMLPQNGADKSPIDCPTEGKLLVRKVGPNGTLHAENPLFDTCDETYSAGENKVLSSLTQKDRTRNSLHTKRSSFNTATVSAKGVSQKRRIKRSEKMAKEFQIAKTGALLLGLFVICYGPYPIVHTCKDFYYIPQWSQHIAMWLVFLNSVISPIIYGFTNKDVRSELRRLSVRMRTKARFSRKAK